MNEAENKIYQALKSLGYDFDVRNPGNTLAWGDQKCIFCGLTWPDFWSAKIGYFHANCSHDVRLDLPVFRITDLSSSWWGRILMRIGNKSHVVTCKYCQTHMGFSVDIRNNALIEFILRHKECVLMSRKDARQ